MFKVNREQLANELGLLQTVAEKKGTMPVLSTVLFVFDGDTLTLTGTDIDMSLITELPASGEPWSGCIPSKQLFDLTRLLNGENVDFLPAENGISIKWGKSRHMLPIYEAAAFPSVTRPQVDLVTLDGKALSTALERALRCISADAKSPWMQGVSLCSREKRLDVTATNSRHLATTKIDTLLNVDLVLSARAAMALSKFLDDETEAGATENQVIFRQGSKVFMARLLDVKYPDWRPLVPANFKHGVLLDPQVSRQAFKLASITARETAMIPIPLRLSLNRSEMEIETEETDRGKSSEIVAIECATLNGDTLSRGVNGHHFLGFLEEDKKAIMSFNDDMRIIQLTYETEPDYRYITMALKA